jgi:hypothetical protein
VEAAERALGSNPMILGSGGLMYGMLGQHARAEEYLHRIESAGEIRYVSPLSVAWIYLGLGLIESCIDWLEKAVEERDPQIIHFGVKPLYAPLRTHPRFQRLIDEMHLAPISAYVPT